MRLELPLPPIFLEDPDETPEYVIEEITDRVANDLLEPHDWGQAPDPAIVRFTGLNWPGWSYEWYRLIYPDRSERDLAVFVTKNLAPAGVVDEASLRITRPWLMTALGAQWARQVRHDAPIDAAKEVLEPQPPSLAIAGRKSLVARS